MRARHPVVAGSVLLLVLLGGQAAAQEATPTHDQLAASLGVSRRTILRDLAALQSADDPATPSA